MNPNKPYIVKHKYEQTNMMVEENISIRLQAPKPKGQNWKSDHVCCEGLSMALNCPGEILLSRRTPLTHHRQIINVQKYE